MAQETENSQRPDGALSERVEQYRREIQSLVEQGVEHPRFEFKRSCSISRDNLGERLDFIKLLQGVANAEVGGERCIAIGADPKEKLFYPVTNAEEFDPATVSGVVAKYLDPLPRFQVFNNLHTDAGEPFVVLVLDAVQPRPVVVKTEGQRPDSKARLQVGEIWIKKGTLQIAARADLDLMYKQRMEEEAEDRARKRFRHFSDLSGASHKGGAPAIRMPVRELLVGPAPEFRRFIEELIAANDYSKFRMLLELARESLVEGWDNLSAREEGLPADPRKYVSEVNSFFRDEFLPSLQSVVTLGLLTIKYDFEIGWLQSVVDGLVEAFEASGGLQRLKSGYVIQEPGSLGWWRPAFEVYVAVRCIATYASHRNRLRFLGAVLPRFVDLITATNRRTVKTPVLFWPLPSLFTGGELNDGRSTFYWKERVSTAWGKYFGSEEKFLRSACELEFLLEFNSYFGTNASNDPKVGDWLEAKARGMSFLYNPDLLAYDLRWTVPMAERLYELIASDQPFPPYLLVEPKLFVLATRDKTREQRLLVYGGFLHYLETWQEKAMFQLFHHWPFGYGWEGRLKDIACEYEAQLPKRA
jgi:hypothetical protein